MPLIIVRNDITKMNVDAIVNAANETLLGGGGVDGCIHRAAGAGLLVECRTLGGCRTGDAKLTKGYNLPCKYVIHTVGPVWHGGGHGEERALISCYNTSLELAKANDCASVAFPLISSGAYGYPKELALKVAVDTIGAFILENYITVYLVVFDRAAFKLGGRLYSDISEYIDDRYAGDRRDKKRRAVFSLPPEEYFDEESCEEDEDDELSGVSAVVQSAAADTGLDEALRRLDESFSQMLLRMIDEKGMTDVQCYKKANIDRKLFSKIRSDTHYRPSKPTVIAFAIALELPLDELKDMLMKAGYALSRSSKFDIIIEYFVKLGNFNIFEINEALFAFDQCLLGAQ